jgi:NADH dehydrogenase (ubiquinone) Fe-S protein 6
MSGPRFEQTNQQFQPRPLAGITMIAEQPIRLVNSRTASCDGGQFSILSLACGWRLIVGRV